MTDFLLGADPELFLRDASGKPFSAHGLIPGDKNKPHKVGDGAIQVDGLALEFNIEPVPSNDFKAFNDKILSVMKTLHSTVKASNPTLSFDIVPSTEFDADYYASIPADAKILGCDPDFCAYSADPLEANPRPGGDGGLRGAGGHIHIGWASDIPEDNLEHIEICRSFIRNLDIFVGLGMTIIDSDERRRKVYGAAGAFRPKSYGVEYRTPSNAWLKSEATRRFIHSLVTAALNDMMKGREAAHLMNGKSGARKRIDAQSIINSGDAVTAHRALTEQLGQRIPEALLELNPKLSPLKKAA